MNTRKLLSAIVCTSLITLGCAVKDRSPNTSNASTTLYSWIEVHADGTRDTAFSPDTANYPGVTPIALGTYLDRPIIQVLLTQSSTTTSQPTKYDDTVCLNYGPKARDSIAIQRITIANKEAIQAALDTLQGSFNQSVLLDAYHFRGDGLTIEISDTSLFAVSTYPSQQTCVADPCHIGEQAACTAVELPAGTALRSGIMVKPNLGRSALIKFWKIIVRNRFGFADTITGASVTTPLNCLQVSNNLSSCQEISAIIHIQDTLYTWIEPYANGYIDTLWSRNINKYYGTKATQFENIYSSGFMRVIQAFSLDTLACPGDSLWLDANGTINMSPKVKATVYLNYGPTARDSLVVPRVFIASKDSFLQSTDTAQFSLHEISPIIPVQHFQGDSASIIIHAPETPISLQWFNPYGGGCSTVFSCNPLLNIQRCRYAADDAPEIDIPEFSVGTLDSTSSGSYAWTIIARNRFGYVDSLQGHTLVIPFTCAN